MEKLKDDLKNIIIADHIKENESSPITIKMVSEELTDILYKWITENFEPKVNPVDLQVMANEVVGGGNFEGAYKYAIKILDDYIKKSEKKAMDEGLSLNDATQYTYKARYMNLAKRTIEENIKAYFLL